MIRRQPTTLSLTAEDVADLEAELEESRLQRELKAQQRNLHRASGTIPHRSNNEVSMALAQEDGHNSPLRKMAPRVSGINEQRPPSETRNGRLEGSASQTAPGGNPFYTER
ncbi:LAFA_0D13784g1_1 [Lachancea sp. 'fantastica']|nr:LAFA_0D13784g1_1 [Lachancea sp. 'fantastica']